MSRLEQAAHLSALRQDFSRVFRKNLVHPVCAIHPILPDDFPNGIRRWLFFFADRKRRWLFLRTAMRRVRSSAHPATLRHNLALAKLSRRPRLWRLVRSSWAPERVVLQAKTLVAAARGRRLAWCPIPGWPSRATAARSDRPSDRGTYTLPMPLCHCRTGRAGQAFIPASARGRRPAAFAGQASLRSRRALSQNSSAPFGETDRTRAGRPGGEGKGAPVPLARVVSQGKPPSRPLATPLPCIGSAVAGCPKGEVKQDGQLATRAAASRQNGLSSAP